MNLYTGFYNFTYMGDLYTQFKGVFIHFIRIILV